MWVMFSKLEGCVAKVATRQKKVIHGHSCKIFVHDLSPDREIMDKGGCCNLQCSGLKKNWFTYFLVFHPHTLKPEIGLEPSLRTIPNKSLKSTPPWTRNRQVPWNAKPLTQEIENLKTWTQLQIEQFLVFANISFTWNPWVSIWKKSLGHDIQNVKQQPRKNLGHWDPWFSQVGWYL